MKLHIIRLSITGIMSLTPPWASAEAPQEIKERARHEFKDMRFGMFIHWGVYAVPAGIYKDEKIGGNTEWILLNKKVPLSEYRKYAERFNPVHYDPKAWVKLAKDAGMKYIVITSKHHDGFALYDSKVTDWDIAGATPYKKDLLKPLIEEARKAGLKIGLYYSQAQDWYHPGGGKGKEWLALKDPKAQEKAGWDPAHKGSFDDYLKNIALPQVKEILDYGIDVLWWDTPYWMTTERARPFADLLSQYPQIITNNRLGGGFQGDTMTPEQHIPAKGYPDRLWEVCMTMNGSWGYSYRDDWKSTKDIIKMLMDISSKGGNYLLNIGPMADGTIPRPSIDRLREVGVWTQACKEAIYGVGISPFRPKKWGRCTTRKLSAETTRLYIMVSDLPQGGIVTFPVGNEVVNSALLTNPAVEVPASGTDGGISLNLNSLELDPLATVIAVDVAGEPSVPNEYVAPNAEGACELMAEQADIHNYPYSVQTSLKVDGGSPVITDWQDENSWISWPVRIQKPGKYEVYADLENEKETAVVMETPKRQKSRLEVPAGSGVKKIGEIEIKATGETEIKLFSAENKKAKMDYGGETENAAWTGFSIRKITLKPIQP